MSENEYIISLKPAKSMMKKLKQDPVRSSNCRKGNDHFYVTNIMFSKDRLVFVQNVISLEMKTETYCSVLFTFKIKECQSSFIEKVLNPIFKYVCSCFCSKKSYNMFLLSLYQKLLSLWIVLFLPPCLFVLVSLQAHCQCL